MKEDIIVIVGVDVGCVESMVEFAIEREDVVINGFARDEGRLGVVQDGHQKGGDNFSNDIGDDTVIGIAN